MAQPIAIRRAAAYRQRAQQLTEAARQMVTHTDTDLMAIHGLQVRVPNHGLQVRVPNDMKTFPVGLIPLP